MTDNPVQTNEEQSAVVWAGRCSVCGQGWSSPETSRQQIRRIALSHIRNEDYDSSHLGEDPQIEIVRREGDEESVVETLSPADRLDAAEVSV